MADTEWLKNLAGASFSGGAWVHENPAAVRRLVEIRLAEALAALYEEATACAEIFNLESHGRRALRVLPIKPKAGVTAGGVMLLLGRCQVNLEAEPPSSLVATLVTVSGFERKPRKLHRFEAQVDAFGSLVWRLQRGDNALLLGNELIMKRLLEDLTRAACEAGDIA